jgi:hypothetical protein
VYTPPSDRFLPALAYSHRVVTRVELVRTDGRVDDLPHTGGTITVDRSQVARRTCSITLADTSLIPRTAADKLSVYGATLRVFRGIGYPDGTSETVPVGVFRVEDVHGDVDLGPVTITGSSLEAQVADAPFTSPTTVLSATTTAVGGITTLIHEVLPDAVVINRATDAAVGTMAWDRQDSRWDAVTTLATAIGAEVYTDAAGQWIIAPLPDLSGPSVVWEVAAGEGGVLISIDRGMSRRGVYNSVTAYGENTADDKPPVSATVEDTDPTSPTYVNGPFGRVPRFYSSATLTSTALCTAAAAQLLKTSLKPNASADIGSLADPRVRGADWRTATVATVGTDGTITTADGVICRRMATYDHPVVGDQIVIHRSGAGNWLAAGRLVRSTDTEWTTYTPAITNGGTAVASTADGWWKRVGGLVYVEVYLTIGTAGSGSSTVMISLPSTPYRGAGNRRQNIPGFSGGLGSGNGPLCGLVLGTGSGARIDQVQDVANAALTGTRLAVNVTLTINGWYREA